MFKPWSVVSDEELKLLRQLAKDVGQLQRGCNCYYDYRCSYCSRIISAKELAEKAEAAR